MNFYPISSLFFYRLIFMGWLIFAEGLFLYKLSKRNHFAPRVIIAIILCFGFALAFPIPTPNAFYSMFMFFCFFGFTMGMAIFCFQANWKSILFSVICGYTAEHIAYETYFGIANFSGIINNGFNGLYQTDTISLFSGPADTLIYFSSFFVVYWLIFVVFVMKLKKRFEYQIKNNNSALLV
ncbi:MAG: hypothetical protein WCR67_01795, partial [Bacilli bacterium]